MVRQFIHILLKKSNESLVEKSNLLNIRLKEIEESIKNAAADTSTDS